MTETHETTHQKTYSSIEAAVELNVDTSRILYLCREKRLGYTLPKHGSAWVITQNEIDIYKAIGPKRPGRPKKPKPFRLYKI